MKLAIIGSRSMQLLNFEEFIPPECEEIVSGGAKGIDQCAAAYARQKGIKLTELLPQYEVYGRAAPIIRNQAIVDYSDEVLAFWDGQSRGTAWVIKYCEKIGKPCHVIKKIQS